MTIIVLRDYYRARSLTAFGQTVRLLRDAGRNAHTLSIPFNKAWPFYAREAWKDAAWTEARS